MPKNYCRRYPIVRVRASVVADAPLPQMMTKVWTSSDCVTAVRAIYRSLLSGDREHFSALYLDSRQRVVGWNHISTGIITASLVHPREVFAPAIEARACGVVLAHNHPSGDPEPSPEDREITRRLVEVGDLVGIRVHDHVVFADEDDAWPGIPPYVSFLERGLI